MAPPVGPTPRPDVHPLPPGTHLLFTQSGRIEHVPLDGYAMKKEGAKAVLHLPVSLPNALSLYILCFWCRTDPLFQMWKLLPIKNKVLVSLLGVELSRPEYSHLLVVISGR